MIVGGGNIEGVVVEQWCVCWCAGGRLSTVVVLEEKKKIKMCGE